MQTAKLLKSFLPSGRYSNADYLTRLPRSPARIYLQPIPHDLYPALSWLWVS